MRLIFWLVSLIRQTRRHIDEVSEMRRSWGENMRNRVIDEEDGWV